MKKYTTDMIKLLALLLATPVLVMAYTKIEKTVSPVAIEKQQTEKAMPGITPVAIGLMNMDKATDADLTVPKRDDVDFILVRSTYNNIDKGCNEKDVVKNETNSKRFALIL